MGGGAAVVISRDLTTALPKVELTDEGAMDFG